MKNKRYTGEISIVSNIIQGTIKYKGMEYKTIRVKINVDEKENIKNKINMFLNDFKNNVEMTGNNKKQKESSFKEITDKLINKNEKGYSKADYNSRSHFGLSVGYEIFNNQYDFEI